MAAGELPAGLMVPVQVRSAWSLRIPGIFIISIALLGVCGCGEHFAHKPAAMESQRIRSELREVIPVPDANVHIPVRYSDPPKIVKQIVGGSEEWKLFYFCRHHSVDQLADIVNDQFASKLFDKKGKETKIADYKVSRLLPTNQLIVRCPAAEDVQAVLATLEIVDVPPIQVRIDCLISEVYADMTMDWETTVEIFDLLGEDITAGGSALPWGDDVLDLIQERPPLPAFPGASLREVARAKMGLKVGYMSLEHNFLAVVDILESKGYLKILMNPSLEVVNGQKARIESMEHVPLEQTFLRDRNDNIETRMEYVDVVDALEVTPHVFADGYIGLETTALIGSKNLPDGVKQIRVVSKREIYNKENRIRQGQSLVIGGIRKSEESTVVRGVPFLKDIPIIGVLFSSKDAEERATETIFILTPTISTGGRPNSEMVDIVRKKQLRRGPTSDIYEEAINPLGHQGRYEPPASEQIPQPRPTTPGTIRAPETAPPAPSAGTADADTAPPTPTEEVQAMLDRLRKSLRDVQDEQAAPIGGEGETRAAKAF